jgi:sortase A
MKTVSKGFAILGLMVLAYWAYQLVAVRYYQAKEIERFSQSRSEVQSAGRDSLSDSLTTVERPYPSRGSAVAMLAIPRLGMEMMVVEGAEERELKLGPGHIRGTSLPGDGGNVGVAGHRDTFFRPLQFIRRDDTIKVTTREREFQYRVISTQIVEPDDIQVLNPLGHETVTLVTCYPFDFLGAAPKRFIVRADCGDCRPQNPIELGSEPRRTR